MSQVRRPRRCRAAGHRAHGRRSSGSTGALARVLHTACQCAHGARVALHIFYRRRFNRKRTCHFHIFHVSHTIHVANVNAILQNAYLATAALANRCLLIITLFFNRTKCLRTSSNLLILNLAILDFIMMAKAPIFIYNSAMRGFATGAFGCQIFALMGAYSGIGAGMTNACIAYDR